MNAVLRRVGSAMSPVALLVALLALVASAAGVGYAAGQIGTSDIKNNAITAKKIKKNAVTAKKIKKNSVTSAKIVDGSVSVADLPAQESQRAAVLGNGGEGDCVWSNSLLPGTAAPTFRKDRFGTVHLAGLSLVSDGAGGDANCDPSDLGQASDAIAFTLPAGYIPAKTILAGGAIGLTVIAGPQGFSEGGSGLALPPGAVSSLGGGGILLDGVEFEPVGSSVAIPKMAASGRVSPEFLASIGAS
jgi:hypothetical protein